MQRGSRRHHLKAWAAATLPLVGGAVLPDAARANAAAKLAGPAFDVRGTLGCGWNLFVRRGYSTARRDIRVNFKYFDHVAAAGLNWLVVFWTNSRQFDDAWEAASEHAHSLGVNLARGVYGFSGGGSEYKMAEPAVPEHLLKPSNAGPKTALCPHETETREWMASILADRIQPNLDGVVIEPAREIRRNCVCKRCLALRHYQWVTYIANFMADELQKLKPNLKIMLHLSAVQKDKAAKQAMAQDLAGLRKSVKTIFAWGIDDTESLTDWFDADPRFCAFTKLGRVTLFPGGVQSKQPIETRVGNLFRWCRLAAERDKSGYMFDWRIFGGTEWKGHEQEPPSTRIDNKLPASIALMGAALRSPSLDEHGQQQLIAELRSKTDWDLDDPTVFYRGRATP